MRLATELYLEHEYKTSLQYQIDDPSGHTDYKVNLAEGFIEAPEQPEPLSKLRKLRRFHTSTWAGGYEEQPHIELMELNLVTEVELEQRELVTVNAVMLKALRDKQTIGQT